jgi:hypothetical protein
MRIRTINMFPNRGAFSTETEIGGKDYLFEFWWSDKNKTWYMDIRDLEGNPVCMGKAVVAGSIPLPGATGVEGAILISGKDYDEPFALGRDVDVYIFDLLD